MSLTDKLRNILNTKNELKTVINEKGGTITDDTPFSDYPVQVSNLTVGGGSGIDVSEFKSISEVVSEAFEYFDSTGENEYIVERFVIASFYTASKTFDSGSIGIQFIDRTDDSFITGTISTNLDVNNFKIGDSVLIKLKKLVKVDESNAEAITSGNGLYITADYAEIIKKFDSELETTSFIDGTLEWFDARLYGITTIRDYGFTGQGKLKTVRLDNVTEIGFCAFQQCSSLKTINIFETLKTIRDGAFSSCTDLTEFTFPNSVTELGVQSFIGCENLISVNNFPALTEIPEDTFSQTGLQNLVLPNTITAIKNGAFYNCDVVNIDTDDSNGGIILNEGLKGIGYSSFANCENLETVVLPDSLTTLGSDAFAGCFNLSSVTFGNNLYEINSGCFANSLKLTSISLPESLFQIGDNAFQGSGISSIDFGTEPVISSIGGTAFGYCNNLTSITLPKSINFLAWGVFYECNNLAEIKYDGTVEEFNRISNEWGWDNIATSVVICTDGEVSIGG